MKDDTLGLYNTSDLREGAKRRLPKGLFEFMDRGNDDEIAMRDNRAALESIKLVPRVLVDVSKRSQEITLFGKHQKMPVIIAPTGSVGLAWYEGEVALARAAAAYGIPYTMAAGSMTAMEKVAAESLPKGMVLDWTELTFQKIIAGNTGIYIFPLSIFLVFLVTPPTKTFVDGSAGAV